MPLTREQIAQRIAQEVPTAKVVMLTVSASDGDLFPALRAGAAGYLLKDIDAGRLSVDGSDGTRSYHLAPVKAAVAIGSPFTFAVQPGLKTFIQRIEPLLRLKMIPTRRITGIALFGAPLPSADQLEPSQRAMWDAGTPPADANVPPA